MKNINPLSPQFGVAVLLLVITVGLFLANQVREASVLFVASSLWIGYIIFMAMRQNNKNGDNTKSS